MRNKISFDRIYVYIVIFVLVGAAALLVQAQDTWNGPQWEYLVIQVNQATGEVTALPLVGDVAAGDAAPDTIAIMTQAEASIAAFNDLVAGTGDFAYPHYLQAAGANGWELVAISDLLLGQEIHIFKRPKP